MSDTTPVNMTKGVFGSIFEGDWRQRLDIVVRGVVELSSTTDPRKMVEIFGERVGSHLSRDGSISLSRRGLEPPNFRITRFSGWAEEDKIDPWTHLHKLPVIAGGVLGDLLFGNEPKIIEDLHVPEDDPAHDYLQGFHGVMAIPGYDNGEALNMTIMLSEDPHGFNHESLPEIVWTANLFGRTIHNLRLGEELQEAYKTIDHEMKVVSDLQHSLLPKSLADIPGMELCVHYEAAQRAGGDYYDFFPLPDGRWGILIADVCGHGPAAAVLMAITHSIAHTYPKKPSSPSNFLDHINRVLCELYTADSKTFVTAFYGVYDPRERSMVYARAGHEKPRIRRASSGAVELFDSDGNLPLGVSADEKHENEKIQLYAGDLVVFYTDGITDVRNADGKFWGTDRLDDLLLSHQDGAKLLKERIVHSLEQFSEGTSFDDDLTLLVARIT